MARRMLLDQLRGDEEFRETPVFVWTSMALADSEYDLLAMTASAILRKGGRPRADA